MTPNEVLSIVLDEYLIRYKLDYTLQVHPKPKELTYSASKLSTLISYKTYNRVGNLSINFLDAIVVTINSKL
jgi:hypothetical protein